MIYAYCDCSYKSPLGVVAAIILDDDMFIDYEVRLYEDVKDSTQGEILAAMLAMELIDKNFSTPQSIKVITDCKVVVIHLNILIRESGNHEFNSYQDEWNKIWEVAKNHRVCTCHINAHSSVCSCNTVCDRASRAVLTLKG